MQINDAITLKFTLDSGASDVSIPADVVSTLIRAGTISRDDFIGARTFVLADGSTVPSAEFRIRSLRLGSMTLHNVVGSLAKDDAQLLLGQSFLSRLKTWSIDNERGVLIAKGVDSDGLTSTPGIPVMASQATAPVANSEPAVASHQPLSPLEAAAASRVADYFDADTTSGDPESEGLRRFYAANVDYYGKATSRDDVMADKHRFAQRWPDRDYRIDPSSIQANCDTSALCVVKGTVQWEAKRQAGAVVSKGSSVFEMKIRGGMIEAESSKVLSRG